MGTSANEHLEQSSSTQLKKQKLYYNISSLTVTVSFKFVAWISQMCIAYTFTNGILH